MNAGSDSDFARGFSSSLRSPAGTACGRQTPADTPQSTTHHPPHTTHKARGVTGRDRVKYWYCGRGATLRLRLRLRVARVVVVARGDWSEAPVAYRAHEVVVLVHHGEELGRLLRHGARGVVRHLPHQDLKKKKKEKKQRNVQYIIGQYSEGRYIREGRDAHRGEGSICCHLELSHTVQQYGVMYQWYCTFCHALLCVALTVYCCL